MKEKKFLLLISISSILILGILFVSISSIKTRMLKIPKLELPQMGGDIPEDMKINVDKSINYLSEKIKPEKLSEADYAFELDGKKSEKYVQKVKKAFKMNIAESKNSESISFEEDDKLLEIFNDGTFVYQIKNKNKSRNIALSDDETKTIATKFLKENELLPEDFFISFVAKETKTEVTLNEDLNETVLNKQVYFNRKINDKFVYGVSRIIVTVGPDGQIEECFSLYREISQKKSYKIKNLDTALKDLREKKGQITVESDASLVNIKDVDLVYWEDSSPNSNQKYIQPVYRFTGEATSLSGMKSDFVGNVPAISDELVR